VDDEPSFRAVVEEILRLQGHTVVCAVCVTEALEILRQYLPDLILTDVMMPDIDGLSFLRTIRSSPALAHIPVIVLTARSSPTDLSDAAMAGATTLLTKPFSAAELRQAIAPFMPTGVA
jgi:CheY-like chemotaxis protein